MLGFVVPSTAEATGYQKMPFFFFVLLICTLLAGMSYFALKYVNDEVSDGWGTQQRKGFFTFDPVCE